MTSAADPLHVPPVTFMGVPATLDLAGVKATVLGVPFDCGVHPFRIGSRQGPQAIREQSALMRRYNSEFADFDPLTRLGVTDRGNVRLTPGKVLESFERERPVESVVLVHRGSLAGEPQGWRVGTSAWKARLGP